MRKSTSATPTYVTPTFTTEALLKYSCFKRLLQWINGSHSDSLLLVGCFHNKYEC